MIRAVREQHPEAWQRWQATGEATLAPVSVPLTRNGASVGEVDAALAMHGPHVAARLPDGASVALVAKPMNIAGLRWWWRCPRLGRACAALFLPDGARGFLSRQAHGLAHRSISERPAVLGAELPSMPPRMREETYLRLCDAIREAEDRALSASARMLARMAAAGA
jgi:hypothetical protein